jgi:glycosyltransferase involved in cell wall biosynthesis
MALEDVKFTSFGVLNRDPLVIHINWYADGVMSKITALSEHLASEKVTFLVGISWSIARLYRDRAIEQFAADYKVHRGRFRNHEIVLLANDLVERGLLRQFGILSEMFQQNAFLCPDDYPLLTSEKRVDAAYIARIEAYKRIELMADLDSALIIYSAVNMTYWRAISAKVSSFQFPNGPPAEPDKQKTLTKAEIAQEIGQARVGLCLSAVEGQMAGSVEYMLLGLPVVSTPSLGGRDSFFDRRCWLWCDDTPEDVALKVREAIGLPISPSEIRAFAIGRIMEIRLGFLQAFQRERSPGYLEMAARLLDIAQPFSRPPTDAASLLATVAAG